MAGPRLVYSALTGEFKNELKKVEAAVTVAQNAAVTEAGEIVKAESKAAFASVGFGRSAQRAMRAAVNPAKPGENDASVDFFLRPAYWSVFENGAVIAGKPLLWLPTDNVPLGSGRKRLTPRQYRARIGELTSARHTKTPMLLGTASRASVLRATPSVVRLRKRAVKSGTLQGAKVPMFIGVPLVRIGKRVDLDGIVRRVGERMGELFAKNLKPV